MDTEKLHVHQFKRTVVPPTCKACGYTLYSCDCGYAHKTDFKPVTDHSFQVTGATVATCTEPGSMTSVCTTCGETKVEPIPALGHAYEQWVMKAYPTCQEPGAQIRKCRRCSNVEERVIKPTGHRCAPETVRYPDEETVEFFCQSCGQTIRCATKNLQPEENPKRYLPTKIVLIAAIAMTLLRVLFMVIYDLSPNAGFINPWLSYSHPALFVLWNLVFLLTVGKIKGNENYTRWMGVATLMYIAYNCASTVMDLLWRLDVYADYMDRGEILMTWLSTAISSFFSIAFYATLTIVFFRGGKKKTWPFVVVLSCTIISAAISGLGVVVTFVSTIEYYREGWYSIWSYLVSISALISSSLSLTALTMLMVPKKKAKALNPAKLASLNAQINI